MDRILHLHRQAMRSIPLPDHERPTGTGGAPQKSPVSGSLWYPLLSSQGPNLKFKMHRRGASVRIVVPGFPEKATPRSIGGAY